MNIKGESIKRSILVGADIHKHRGNSNLGAVLSLVRDDLQAVQPEVVLLGGDNAGGGKPPRMGGSLDDWEPVYDPEEIKAEVRSALGRDVPVCLTYGSHDKCAIGGMKGFLCGPWDCRAFYIYGISFCQMKFARKEQLQESREKFSGKIIKYDGPDVEGPYGCCAEEAAEYFTEWEESLNDNKPLFVMSHVPMHAQRHDNLGASIWCDALNKAAKHRSVFVFYAHNHSAEHRFPDERHYYLVPSGNIMRLQGSEKEEVINKKLDFTYLNAGYILEGCVTLLTLEYEEGSEEASSVLVKRYSMTPEGAAFGDTGLPMPYVQQLK